LKENLLKERIEEEMEEIMEKYNLYATYLESVEKHTIRMSLN
jgi:hypothetical protein